MLCINAFTIPQMNNPFMVMNDDCYVDPGQQYGCGDVPYILMFDPDEKQDIEYICNKSKANDFTNQQFADITTRRFHDLGFSTCNISVFKKFINYQFKDQCPIMFNKYCIQDYSKILKYFDKIVWDDLITKIEDTKKRWVNRRRKN
jgi:hypothetical protein